MKSIHSVLKELDACRSALRWAKQYKTIEEIIENVHRGDWLLWLGDELDLPLKEITLAKARCAKTVFHLMKDERSRNAVEVAEKFGLGEATLEELKKVASYAGAASDDASANDDGADYYAAFTSYCAVVTYTVYNIAYYAAKASYYDVYGKNSDYDKVHYAAEENRKLTANICRETLGQLIINKINTL